MAKNTKPTIRFKGFTDDWEQRKLGDIGSARSGVGFPDAEQGGIEGIPFFKVSDMNNVGNENELVSANNYVSDEQIKRKRWNVITDVPAIFFAKVGAAVMLNRKRLVRFPFLLDNNTMAYIFDKKTWDCDFGKTLFETIDLTKLTQTGALPSYNASDVEDIEIYLPNIEEQKAIGALFLQLDNLITLHQRKYDSLVNVKKAMFEKMFPKNGETVPEIRFKGFTDTWEQREFDDFFEYIPHNSLSRDNLNYDEGEVKNIHYGDVLIKFGEVLNPTIEKIPFVNKDIKFDDKSCFLQDGDIVIADAAEDLTVGKCTEISNGCNQKLVAGLHTIPCRPKNKIEEGFLGFYLNSKAYHNQLLPLIQGTKVSSISKSSLKETWVTFPFSSNEQKKIGSFFLTLNNLITLHQRRLEKLKNIKKSCLEKMFV